MEFLSEILTFAIDSVIFAICLREYVHYKNAIKAVDGVEVYNVGPELQAVLDKSPDNKIDYIAVKGAVQSLGEPLRSINRRDVIGVVRKLSVKEHVVAKTTAGFWSDQERIVQSVYNVVPFVLRKGSYRVEIIDPLSADILDLDMISDNFQPSVPTIVDYVWGFFTGIRQRGVQSTEKMLRVDSIVTAIGELSTSEAKSDSLTLQPPFNRSPFYITSMSITALMRELDNRRRTYKVLCLILGAVGLLIGGVGARRYWKYRLDQRVAEELRQSLEESRKRRRQRVRDRDLRTDQICVVCNSNAREIILLPCGHVCICEDCSENINNNCPICRTPIMQKAAAYII